MFLAVADAYLHGGLFHLGVGHLRGYGAEAYQTVEFLLLSRPLDCLLVHIGGTDGLVGLLRAFR